MTRIEELEDENFLLKEQLRSYLPLPEWGFAGRQVIMFMALSENRVATRETFNIAIQRLCGDESTPDTIDVYISEMRRKLKDKGAPFEIRTHAGLGWSLIKLDEKEKEQ